jgi:hypothetical protein
MHCLCLTPTQRQSQVIGALVEPMNEVEQSLVLYLIMKQLSSTRHIKRRGLIIGGSGLSCVGSAH